jgi:hypothetical protein
LFQRLSVKFNFEGLDDPNDERWLELDCVNCSISKLENEKKSNQSLSRPESSSEDEEDQKM